MGFPRTFSEVSFKIFYFFKKFYSVLMGFLGQGKFSRLDPRFIYFQKEELTFYEFIDIGFRSQVFSVIAIKFYLFRYSCMTSSLNK